jgi:hypothetical protein
MMMEALFSFETSANFYQNYKEDIIFRSLSKYSVPLTPPCPWKAVLVVRLGIVRPSVSTNSHNFRPTTKFVITDTLSVTGTEHRQNDTCVSLRPFIL